MGRDKKKKHRPPSCDVQGLPSVTEASHGVEVQQIQDATVDGSSSLDVHGLPSETVAFYGGKVQQLQDATVDGSAVLALPTSNVEMNPDPFPPLRGSLEPPSNENLASKVFDEIPEPKENEKLNWKLIVAQNRKFTSSTKLKFVPPVNGRVVINPADLEDVPKTWGFPLIGYVAGKNPGKLAIIEVCKKWNIKYKVHFHDKGWKIFRFFSEEDSNKVLEAAPYNVYGRSLILKPMPELFDFNSFELCTVPIWIQLPGLPLAMWNFESLSKIGSKLGIPIQSDAMTMEKESVGYARLLVDIDISKGLPSHVEIDLPRSTLRQPVTYEFIPKFCKDCKGIGHIPVSCPIKQQNQTHSGTEKPGKQRSNRSKSRPRRSKSRVRSDGDKARDSDTPAQARDAADAPTDPTLYSEPPFISPKNPAKARAASASPLSNRTRQPEINGGAFECLAADIGTIEAPVEEGTDRHQKPSRGRSKSRAPGPIQKEKPVEVHTDTGAENQPATEANQPHRPSSKSRKASRKHAATGVQHRQGSNDSVGKEAGYKDRKRDKSVTTSRDCKEVDKGKGATPPPTQ